MRQKVAFAVTTRSHLRGVRFFPSMMRASMRIRRQLADTPGCLRFASIVMGPREFWTITVWQSRGEMLDFMRSGAHEDVMWEFSDWLDSFWLMRWRPSADESGDWSGSHLSQKPALPQPPPDRTPGERAALDAVFDAIPRLKAAASPSGAPQLEYSPQQQRARRLVAGGVGSTLRVELPRPAAMPGAWLRVRALHRSLLRHDDVLRSAFGVSRARELYLLAVFRSSEAWDAFVASDAVGDLRERYPGGIWTMKWEADNEFGHWDGLRLRRAKLGSKVTVPDKYGRIIGGPGHAPGGPPPKPPARRSR